MADSDTRLIPPLLSYSAISVALLLPVLVWPLQGLNDGAHSLAFETDWLITASALLLCAVTADTILYHQPVDSKWPLFAAIWILATSMAVSLALRSELGSYLLATMFSLHAIRSGLRLWLNGDAWWLTVACVRDTIAALSIFGWIIIISMAHS
ncbi:hypothetical protein Ga0123461_0390 [Mariprofundus aestuarium]|uniref:Uncharacterized protein n=1 Tax=Mariprofundus aestuarium TaxID=1921086 RepID=A0A2K8KW24_MARES|nr:hypothetical protein [Mariprofundus aestuarium]ATX78832.1 hypothetical protein Ga0123461_0390 [Mariprofundus aestuarium]